MDDLIGLSFNPSSNTTTSQSSQPSKSPSPFGSTLNSKPTPYANYNALRPTSATPPSRGPSPGAKGSGIRNTGSNSNGTKVDSFANLVPFGGSKNDTGNLSLLEQQKRLQEQKAKEEEEKRRQFDRQFGGGEGGKFWDNLAATGSTTTPSVQVTKDEDEDLFAAFKASAPVDRSSYFPPPSTGSNSASAFATPRFGTPNPFQERKLHTAAVVAPDPFDDLLGLDSSLPPVGAAPSQPPVVSSTSNNDDNDVLGLLGKPVSELPPRLTTSPQPAPVEELKQDIAPTSDPRDAAIAEIMDMGFSLTQARKALAETDTGLDVQQAVSWLLNEAHRQAKAAKPASSTPRDHSRGPPHENDRHRRMDRGSERRRDGSEHRQQPAWAHDGGSGSGEKDIAAIASEVGSNFLKSANSLWSQGKKKVAKAVQEFQQDRDSDDSGMPKWMRDAQLHQQAPPERRGTSRDQRDPVTGPVDGTRDRRGPQQPAQDLLTEEALMLEGGSGPPRKPSRKTEHTPEPPLRNQTNSPAAKQSAAEIQRRRELEFAELVRRKEQELRERESAASSRRAKLTREANEEEAAAYISPARRRKPAETPPPSQSKTPVPAPSAGSLFDDDDTGKARPSETSRNPFQNYMQPTQRPAPPPPRPKQPTPQIQVRKQVFKRAPVSISPAAISSSTKSRLAGSEAFKLGDYSSALLHYTSALSPVPENHTLRILLLCNRAICNLKVGDSKACIADCEAALALIGEGRGEGEVILLEDGNRTTKDMKEFWDKAWARKAEALEQLEKWADALRCWNVLVEAGAGGANAISGKRRCENAIAPKPKPSLPTPSTIPKSRSAPPVPTAPRRPPPPPTKSSQEAVTRLRQQNANQEKTEQEKFALYDSVQERIQQWKGGKEGNLRALLTSLDGILWEGSGWKKIGMHELVVPQKVKIQYMKGIAKVHPDKLPVDATTEQKMISATVFMLLNEAWDKFKIDNKL